MKKHTFFTQLIVLLLCSSSAFAVPGVTLSTVTTAAGDIAQGTNTNIIYILKADVVTDPVTFNIITFTLTGTHDNNDLNNVNVFTNTTPSLTGATNAGALAAAFAAPHTYNLNVSSTVAAGTTRYFIITANVAASATHNNTVKIDGAANPISFTYSVAPVLTNNQADAAGVQTIKAADVALSAVAVPAASLAQGTSINIVYIVKADVSNFNATVSSVSFTLTGTHDNNDLNNVNVFSNTTPSLTGSNNEGALTATFAAPHTYTLNFGHNITAGTTRYFIITASVNVAATHNNTIKLDGAVNPVTINFTTSPNITNNQTDAAGLQTIKAADVALSTVAVPAANLTQGSSTNIVYIVKADVSNFNATVSSLSFTLTGTHDNNDLNNVNVFSNTTPSLTGSNNEGALTATFAAPHTYTLNFGHNITAGTTRYFIITATINVAGTHNNTIKLDGAANPVTINFTTSPNITNNQTDAAGVQTIKAADVALSAEAVAASNVAQGTTNNIIYIVKADVSGLNANVSSVIFTLTGTHDNNDLTNVNVYSNSTASLTGATNEGALTATFAAPHTYTLNFSRVLTAGTTRYFIITANINASGTFNNTIKIDGAVNPVTFNFTTSPNISNTQTDAAGVQTILASGVTYSSVPVAAGNVLQGTNSNILYILKTDITSQNLTTSNISFTLSGTHDNNDLTNVNVYSNTTPSLTGAVNEGALTATFAAPHAYTLNFSSSLTAGSTRYFIITANINSSATHNNTIKIDGLTNPVSITFLTSPNITNNQTDAAGAQTIKGPAVTLSTPLLPGGIILPGETNKIIYAVQADNELFAQNITGASFTVSGTFDNNDISQYSLYSNSSNSLTGATLLQTKPSGAAAPNTVTFTFSQPVTASATTYFILTASLDAAATGSNTIKVDGAAIPASFTYSLSPFVTNNQADNAGTFSISNILPVTLTGFTAVSANGPVHLNWSTASELNTAWFEVLHSTDGITFTPIAKIAAAGGNNLTKNYSVWHTAAAPGINYYRLKITDKDNSIAYSAILTVMNKQEAPLVQLYPNPAASQINIHFRHNGSGTARLNIYNAAGVLVNSSRIAVANGFNRWQKDISRLAAGLYQAVAVDAGNNTLFKTAFIKSIN